MEKNKNTVSIKNLQKLTNKELFYKQKETLDIFLAHGTISKEQYEVSLAGLKNKMKIED